MRQYSFSRHALEMMSDRNISMQKVLSVWNNPLPPRDIDIENNKVIYQAIVNFEAEGKYLVRVFVNPAKEPPLVITVYRTSEIEKYYES